MTRKENLIALRDAVVVGKWDTRHDQPEENTGLRGWSLCIDRIVCNSDMNGALAFVAEVLPGWNWGRYSSGNEMYLTKHGVAVHSINARSDTPARALLIAALNALIEETEE